VRRRSSHVTRCEQAARTGKRWGTNRPGAPTAGSISGACRCAPPRTAIGFSSTEPACELALSVRPGAGDAHFRRRRRGASIASAAPAASRSAFAYQPGFCSAARRLVRAVSRSSRAGAVAVPVAGDVFSSASRWRAPMRSDTTVGPRRLDPPPSHCLGRGRGRSAPLARLRRWPRTRSIDRSTGDLCAESPCAGDRSPTERTTSTRGVRARGHGPLALSSQRSRVSSRCPT